MIWPSRIVRWTGLSRSTVWDALRRLEETGIAVPTPIELRRQFPWRIPYRHPLEESLCALFVAERKAARWARMSEEERADERDLQEVLARTKASLEARGIPFDADFWDP